MIHRQNHISETDTRAHRGRLLIVAGVWVSSLVVGWGLVFIAAFLVRILISVTK